MQYELIITTIAQFDILEASDWYEGRRNGLGKLFMLSLEKRIELILKNPLGFALIYKQIRRANTQKFPYSLYYRVNENTNQVTIVAVIHNSRSVQVWKQRIDEMETD